MQLKSDVEIDKHNLIANATDQRKKESEDYPMGNRSADFEVRAATLGSEYLRAKANDSNLAKPASSKNNESIKPATLGTEEPIIENIDDNHLPVNAAKSHEF